VTSLETGRLNLSEETAIKISDETGVAMKWLLDGKPKKKTYETDPIDGSKHPYTKEIFERIQAHKKKGITYSSNPNTRLEPLLPPPLGSQFLMRRMKLEDPISPFTCCTSL
jgi:hypothetical protein